MLQLTYMGAPGGRIAGGTDEIMANIIAERVQMPQEPRGYDCGRHAVYRGTNGQQLIDAD